MTPVDEAHKIVHLAAPDEPDGLPENDIIGVLVQTLRMLRKDVHQSQMDIAELRALLNDSEERANKLRQTLAFRIGRLIVATRTFGSALRLPYRLWREVRSFRQTRSDTVVLPSPEETGAQTAVWLERVGELAARGEIHRVIGWIRKNVKSPPARARLLVKAAQVVAQRDPKAETLAVIAAIKADPTSSHARRALLTIAADTTAAERHALLATFAEAGGKWTTAEEQFVRTLFAAVQPKPAESLVS